MKRKQQGFTLIELMIVIAIIAILLAIAVPAYQDYSVRAKNSECINVAAGAKLAASEFVQTEGDWPATAAEAGWDFQGSQYCATIAIAGNTITATTQATGGDPLAVFNFAGTFVSGEGAVTWECTETGGAKTRQVPTECRAPAEGGGETADGGETTG